MADISDNAETSTIAAKELLDQVAPMFAGVEPEVVGGVLGMLLAKLIAGHCPEMRAEAMKLVIDMANDLIPIEIDEMIAAGRAPEHWRGTRQ